MNDLSVTIITRDEERDLPRALDSVQAIADEVVIVDSGSTDRTVALARGRGARTMVREWTNYGDQKNFAAAQATYDWIFNLDADEVLSPALRDSLHRWKGIPPGAVAYSVNRRANYLGRWIRHGGWYPDVKIRLYHRDRARFTGALHESVLADGPVEHLEGDLFHYTVGTFDEHRFRVDRYTTLAAEELFARGHRRWLARMLLAPPWAFLRTYVLQQGFRDGYCGWLIGRMAAYYVFLKYRKLGRLAKEASRSSGG